MARGSLPESVERQVVRTLFLEAELIRWEFLSTHARSKQYSLWLASPSVGGLLQNFMSLEDARVWIKDGPMKEFARATNGLGKHADLVTRRLPPPSEIVARCLGPGWNVDMDSLQIKPLRIRAHREDHRSTLAWGPLRDFKHLVWAALQARASGDRDAWTLCVTAPFENPTPRNVQAHNERIVTSCNLEVVHILI